MTPEQLLRAAEAKLRAVENNLTECVASLNEHKVRHGVGAPTSEAVALAHAQAAVAQAYRRRPMITRIIELSCDHDGCDVAYAPSETEQTSLHLTRIGSAVTGWTRRDGRDYCPDHRADDRADAIRRLAGQRLTDTQIGQRLGIHRAHVQKIRSEHGIAPGLGRVGRPSTLGGVR